MEITKAKIGIIGLGYALMNDMGIQIIPNNVILLCVVFISSWLIFKFIEQPSQLHLKNWFNRLLLKKKAIPTYSYE